MKIHVIIEEEDGTAIRQTWNANSQQAINTIRDVTSMIGPPAQKRMAHVVNDTETGTIAIQT